MARNRLEVSGHALCGSPGHDVVCAAVSALSQALVYGLAEVAGVAVTVESWDHGRLAAHWPLPLSEPAAAVVATLSGSLREVAARHAAAVEVVME